MKLELEVLASTTIKRKKPWPRLAWVGQAQESVMLMDRQRLSILYIPSGKTKRHISKLQPLLDDVLVLATSRNGHLVGGVLRSGNLFLWHKDLDSLKKIHGMPEFGSSVDPDDLQLFLSGDGTRLLVVFGRNLVFVWEADRAVFSTPESYVPGLWTQVLPSGGVSLPERNFKETSIDAHFYEDSVLGACCSCSFVFNTGSSVCISTLLLRWMEPHHIHMYSALTYRAEWTSMRQPLRNVCDQDQPLRTQGAYIARHANDGHLLAVAVNRQCSHDNRMLFVSSLTDTVIIRDMLGSGTRSHVIGSAARRYWVCDVQWSADDLLVVCMTEQGSLCILSRLGEPLLLQTCGHNMDMGPKCFLPLHPRISVQSSVASYSNHNRDDINDFFAVDADPMSQQFSIAMHPRLPIVLCSDGYLVTALQLPGDTTCLGMMKGLLMESTSQLKLIREKRKSKLHIVESFKAARLKNNENYGTNTGTRLGLRLTKAMADRQQIYMRSTSYSFEEPDLEALNATDDVPHLRGMPSSSNSILAVESGKIVFGDVDNMNNTLDYDALSRVDSGDVVDLLSRVEKTLLSAWSIGCSHTGLWTQDHEEIASQLVYNIAHLCTALLQCSAEDILTLSPKTNVSQREQAGRTLQLTKVLSIIKTLFHLLRLNSVYRHMMVSTLRLSSSIVSVLVACDPLHGDGRPIQTLHGCYVVLCFMEQVLRHVYTDLPQLGSSNACVGQVLTHFRDICQPSILSSVQYTGLTTPRGSIQSQSSNDGSLPHGRAPNGHDVMSETEDYRLKDRIDGDYLDISSEAEDYKMQRIRIGSDSGPPEYTSKQSSPQQKAPAGPYEGWRRLAPAWKLLYTHVIKAYKATAVRKGKKKKTMDALLKLMASIQCRLQILSTTLLQKKRKVAPGERMCIEGCGAPAMKAWVHTLHKAQDAPYTKVSVSRVLHAMLYTLLLQSELRSAVELVELLIRQQDLKTVAALFRQDHATKSSVLALLQQVPLSQQVVPPCYIQTEAVRELVQTMARIMAAYFTNTQVFVFPPHAPRKVPPLHGTKHIKHRVLPLYASQLSSILSQASLANVWTPARTLEYLLLAGLLVEAVWFAHGLGDWKSAFVIAVACQERPPIKIKDKQATALRVLPNTLQPTVLLQAKLQEVFTVTKEKDILSSGLSEAMLHPGLSDVLLAGAVCYTDIAPALLEYLLTQIKVKAKQATLLVHSGFYLPAPPIYCPQLLPEDSNSQALEVAAERELRSQVSSLVRLYMLVLNCARCTLPTARWFADKVLRACRLGQKFKGTKSWEEPDIPMLAQSFLGMGSHFHDNETDVHILRVLQSFRDLCSLVWMFHVRDKLSLALRNRARLSDKRQEGSVTGSEWDRHVRETLHWASQLLPFTRHMGQDQDIYALLLSLIIELPMSADTATVLSRFFYDAESLSPETQEKLQAVLKDWQSIFLENKSTKGSVRLASLPGRSPRGITMSFYFQRQTQKAEQVFRKKAHIFGEYEVFVFDPETEAVEAAQSDSDQVLCVGARPCESEWDYLVFLDTLYSVCFHKEVDIEGQMAHLKPRLITFSKEIRKKELNSLAHQAVASLQRKHSSPRSPASPGLPSFIMPSPPPVKSPPVQAPPPISPRTKVGLFRSRSFSEIHTRKKRRLQQRPQSASTIRRSSSQNDIDRTVLPGGLKGEHEVLDAVSRMRRNSGGSQHSRSGSAKDAAAPIDGSADDPLTNLVLPAWLLEQIEFGPAYASLEKLMNWLSRWSRRHHMLGDSPETSHPVIRLQPHPQLLVYALWQQESRDQVTKTKDSKHKSKKAKAEKKVKKAVSNVDDKAQSENMNNNHGSRETPRETPASQPTTRPSSSMSECTLPESDQIDRPKTKHKKKLSFKDEEPTERPLVVRPEPVQAASPQRQPFRIQRKRSQSPEPRSPSGTSLSISSLNVEDLDVPDDSILARELAHSEAMVHTGINTSLPQPADNPHPPGTMEHDLLALELRDIVRKEVRKIVEAQHHGILAMLGALEDGPVPNGVAQQHELAGSREERLSSAGREYTVMSVHAMNEPDPKSATDVEVTPLPSDAISLDDDPLTMSDLGKYVPKEAHGRPPQSQTGLRGALHELKQMENQVHTVPPVGPHQGKENAIPWATPVQPADPSFSRVMAMLRHVNHSVLGVPQRPGAPAVPMLLHASPRTDGSVHLPYIPGSFTPGPHSATAPQSSRVGPVPLLYQPSRQQQVDQLPVRGPSVLQGMNSQRPVMPGQPQFAGFGMPLLQMPGPNIPRMFPHLQDTQGIPRLLPPSEVFGYQQLPETQSEPAITAQEPLGSRLLQAHTRPPSVPSEAKITPMTDTRDSNKRKQRRQQLESNPSLLLSQKSTTDSVTQPDLELSLTPQSDFGVQVEEPEKDIVSEGVQTSARSSRRQSQIREEESKAEQQESLHHGYALTPGMFDEYLKADTELGSAADTHAKLQYQAVMGTKKETTHSMAIQTDGPGWQEEAIMSDADPVQEAITSYRQAKRQAGSCGLLPPDVYLGLTFQDAGSEPQPGSGGSSGGRAFINVVDLGGDALQDLTANVPEKEELTTADKVDMQGTPIRHPLREPHRESPERDVESPTRPPGPDSLTANLLLRRPEELDQVTGDDIVRNSRARTKYSIRQRLNDMNAQFDAIEKMSGKMEDDFSNTKLLMHTLDQLGEAMMPEESKVPEVPEHPEPAEDQVFQNRLPLRPSDVRRFAGEDKRVPKPKAVQMEPLDDSLNTSGTVKNIKYMLGQSEEMGTTAGDSRLDLTGLSGVSDIVGELIQKGGLDPEDAGLSKRDVQKLAQKSRDTSVKKSPARSSVPAGAPVSGRTEEERQELREWMEKRREQKMQEFKQKRDAMREAEAQPYAALADESSKHMPQSEYMKREQQRMEEKARRDAEHLRQREQMAGTLMGDLLTDRISLPEDIPVVPASPKLKRQTSPARRTSPARQTSPARSKAKQPGTPTKAKTKRITAPAARVARSPERRVGSMAYYDHDRMDVSLDDYANVRDSYNRVPTQQPAGPVRHSAESSHRAGDTDTSGFLGAYTQQLAEVDERPEDTLKAATDENKENTMQAVAKTRPYTDFVRVQRPEVTRQTKGFTAKPLSYTERLAQTAGSSTQRSGASTQRSQPSVYGTKRTPGLPTKTTPRSVKTYTERLQDMKQAQPARQPLKRLPRPSTKLKDPGSTMSTMSSMKSTLTQTKPRRTKTYQEQLQELQPSKENYRTGMTMTQRAGQPPMVRQRLGPRHKPKTYVKQLQELQQPITPSQVTRGDQARASRRSRPYGDPYSGEPDLDDLTFSDVSPWSMDVDMHQLLYDDSQATRPGASMAATEDDISDFSEGDLALGADYTDLVGINDIEDAMSEGSILSFIDWDQVDQLIATID